MMLYTNDKDEIFDYCFSIWKKIFKTTPTLKRVTAHSLFFLDNTCVNSTDVSNNYIALFCPQEINNDDEFVKYKPYPAFSDYWTRTFMVGQFITATNLALAENDERLIMATWLYGYLDKTYAFNDNNIFRLLYDACEEKVSRHYSSFMKNVCFYDADMFDEYDDDNTDTLDKLIAKAAKHYNEFICDYKLLIINAKNEGFGRYINLDNIDIWQEDSNSKEHIRNLHCNDLLLEFRKERFDSITLPKIK